MTTAAPAGRFGDRPSVVRAAGLADADLALTPLDAANVRTGPAEVRHLALVETPQLSVGVWQHGPGVSTDVEVDEVFVVLGGRATIEIEGWPTLSVGTGDVVAVPAGAVTVWTIQETLRKVYIVGSALSPADPAPPG